MSPKENDDMIMGYIIETNETATDSFCPICGRWAPSSGGLVIVQRPSGDIVCDACAEVELKAPFEDIQVLRDDTPTDFPELWPELAQCLAVRPDEDYDLSLLLESVGGLQRYTGPGARGPLWDRASARSRPRHHRPPDQRAALHATHPLSKRGRVREMSWMTGFGTAGRLDRCRVPRDFAIGMPVRADMGAPLSAEDHT